MNERIMPTEIIDLPSKGWFYDPKSPLASGKVEMRYMSAKDEDILTSKNLINKGVVLDVLLKHLLVDKTINYDDLLVADKDAIFVAARVLAYGANYVVEVQCPECGEKNKDTEINLADVENVDFDETQFDKGINEFEYELPKSKVVVRFKLATNADEKEIENQLKKASRKLGSNDSAITTRLLVVLVEVDGSREKKDIASFVYNEMSSIDSLSLRQYIKEISPKIDLTFPFTCQHCGSEDNRLEVPMTAEFFWPSRKL